MEDFIKKIVNEMFMEDDNGSLILSKFGFLFTIFFAVSLFCYFMKGSENNESNL